MPLRAHSHEVFRPGIVLIKFHHHLRSDLGRRRCNAVHPLDRSLIVIEGARFKGHPVKRAIVVPPEHTLEEDDVVRRRRLSAAFIYHSIDFFPYALADLTW